MTNWACWLTSSLDSMCIVSQSVAKNFGIDKLADELLCFAVAAASNRSVASDAAVTGGSPSSIAGV